MNIWQRIEYLTEGPAKRGAGYEDYEFRNLSPIIQAFIAPMFLLSDTYFNPENNWLDKLAMTAIYPFLMVLSDFSLLFLTIVDSIAILFHYSTSIMLESVAVLANFVLGTPWADLDLSQLYYPDIVRNNRDTIAMFWTAKVMYRIFFFEVLFFPDVL